ncbi:ABC transporter permease [Microbacterium sp. SA39]|uniref:ABC transporter permease n=1 Tax=Microbacterium sp. SA39 TaxID=1263625 RepID=UPI00061F4C0B|nr:ABC transporter permease [Microbacterium sp. SA39]KJQ53885.1 Branched-chain amino acid transport system / permease component [Microbacterium sp. SA39]
MRMSIRPKTAVTVGLVLLGVVVGLYGLFALTSDNPMSALQGLFSGAVSSPGRIAQWLSYASFLMITGASVCLVFRVGMFSIGAEGQVFVAALLSGALVLMLGPSPFALPLAIVAAALAGFLWGVISGLMKAYLGADEIVTTLMMNYIATFLFAFVVKEFLQPADAGFPVSEFFDPSSWFPTVGSSPAISTTLVLGVAVCLITSLVLNRSRFGYRLRVVGSSPRFAHANGMPVARLIWLSIAVSGAVAGLAGAAIAFGGTNRLILGMATGIGFDGILVALLAANRPILVPVMALAYGFLRTGGDVIQITSNVPRDIVVVLQGVIILVLAAGMRYWEQRADRTVVDPAASSTTVALATAHPAKSLLGRPKGASGRPTTSASDTSSVDVTPTAEEDTERSSRVPRQRS